MKKIIITLLIFTCFAVFSQAKKISLDWNNDRLKQCLTLEDFDPTTIDKNLTFTNVNKRLNYNFLIDFDLPFFVKSAKITKVNYDDLGEVFIDEGLRSSLSAEIEVEISQVQTNEKKQFVLSFTPIIIQNGRIKRVKNIEFEFDKEAISATKTLLANKSVNVFQSNSLLKTGKWFQFTIDKTGIYKIDKSFLQQLGVPDNIDPRTIQIFGQGGTMLSIINHVDFVTDPIENSIYVFGEEDGRLDASDYILFYGVGTDQWNNESLTFNNLFSDKAVYFLTYGNQNGLRIQPAVQPQGNPSTVISTFDGLVFHEKDLVNIAKVGRKWFGEDFGIVNERTFSFYLMHFNKQFPVTFGINTASSSFGNSGFYFNVNQRNIGGVSFFPIRNSTTKAYETFFGSTEYLASSNVQVTLNYQNGGVPTSIGYLDYIEITYTGNLIGGNKQYFFTNKETTSLSGIVQWNVAETDKVSKIWEISNSNDITFFDVNFSSNYSFKTIGKEDAKFIMDLPSDYYVPAFAENNSIRNQDVKGQVNAKQAIDYLVITTNSFKSAANKLARFHQQRGLKPYVVSVEDIYNEFSHGQQDGSAIRNFVRYVYNLSLQKGELLKYVNILGSGSYDYKNRISNNANIVPLYYGMSSVKKAQNSSSNFSMYTTFMSDDFYGLMDLNEGDMTQLPFGIDVTVGRMLAKNNDEANKAVDRVINYYSNESRGRWKNNIIGLADDVERESDFVLQVDSDEIMNFITTHNPFFNSNKIYMDAYVKETSAGGKRYPQVQKDFIESINKGALFINYLGHGGGDALSQERVFTIDNAKNLKNENKLGVFSIITCEFSRFDDPNYLSGGEALYSNNIGGAVALVGTTREIGIDSGRLLNKSFAEILFEKPDNYSVADALREAKNRSVNRDKSVVSFIGDPALKLALPQLKIVLTKKNNEDITIDTLPIKALDYVKFNGEIQDESNQLIESFSGNLAVEVFDKYIEKNTLGNDNITSNGELMVMDFKTLGEVAFRGNASVQNGLFSFDFIMPKDIRLNEGKGKVSLYSSNNKKEFTGSNTDIIIGGFNENAPKDVAPPQVKLFMNNESFVSGGITNNKPVFIAFIEDASGINTASGIGHDIVLTIDDNNDQSIVLNDYYETDVDSFQKGKITYPLNELSPGMHTIQFKVWDVYNNLTTSEIQFLVQEQNDLKIEKVLNYPNPFVNYTEFWFTHNRPLEPLDVQVQIMTITGRIVKTINQQIVTEGNLCRTIQWDGRDDFGDKLAKGVYIYRLQVKSSVSGKKSDKIEKLVIL